MENLFSISKTAKMVNMTTETLRHYDRIGLVKPYKVDQFTGYRYYSEQEIVMLNTIKILSFMNLTLAEIKEILQYDDFEKVIKALQKAEVSADEKIKEINYAKSKIQKARQFYQSKLNEQKDNKNIYVKEFAERVILLSDELQMPTIDNLWDYHRHFYKQIGEKNKYSFSFEDLAGVYCENQNSKMFAVCVKHIDIDGLKTLPAGNYLCADCTKENSEQVLENLFALAKQQYNIEPQFNIKIVVLSGILQWNYQLQIYIGK